MALTTCQQIGMRLEAVIDEQKHLLSTRTAELSQELEREAAALQEDAPNTTGGDAAVGFEFEVKFTPKTFSFHYPRIQVKNENLSLHLPQVTMGNRRVVFHTPSTRTVRKRVGSHPKTTCKTEYKKVGPVRVAYPKCTTSWDPIWIDVPEVFMQKQEIQIVYPEVAMKRTDFVIGVPQLDMDLKSFTINIPEFRIRRLTDEARELESRANSMQQEYTQRYEEVQDTFKHDLSEAIVKPHSELFDCLRGDLQASKVKSLQEMDAVINSLNLSVKTLKENDTEADNEYLAQLEKQRVEMIKSRQGIVKEFDVAFGRLENDQRTSLERIMAGIDN